MKLKEWAIQKLWFKKLKGITLEQLYFGKRTGVNIIVLPLFHIAENKVSLGELAPSPLCEAMERKYVVGIILAAWGSYSIGIFQGDDLVESKTGKGYIHKRHRKGRRSERRFAHRTEEQKKDFLRKVGNRIEKRFIN